MKTTNEPELIKLNPELIDASPYQSRKVFDEEKLKELTASVLEHGIIQPLVARRMAGSERLELVAGERRLRAGKAAGLALVPVLVSEISDAAAEAMVLTENLQREDLTPLEEAQAFERLLKLKDDQGTALYTQAGLAKMVSKNLEYVTARLKLLVCPAELVAAVNAGEVSVSTAMLVGRVPDAMARVKCAKMLLKPETQEIPLNYEQTKHLIREQFMVELSKKNFSLDDPELVPVKLDAAGERWQGGACVDCPFRSGNIEGINPKVELPRNSVEGQTKWRSTGVFDADLCTLPRCHRLKLDAQWRVRKHDAELAGHATLDGKAAEKVFGGYNGRIAYDAGYVLIDAESYIDGHGSIKPRSVVKTQKLTVTLARHPETFKVVELIAEKELKAALNSVKKADQGDSAAAAQEEENEKQKRAKELLQNKLDKIALHEGVNDIVNAIMTRGVDAEYLSYVFQMALDSGGSDGMTFMSQWLNIKLPKGAHHSGRDYEDEVLKIVKERCETPNAWHAYITVALLARGLKWAGVRDNDFEQVLARYGIKMKDLERRAEALIKAEKQPKKDKPAPDEKKGGKGEGWNVDKVNETVAAGGAVAKGRGDGIVRDLATEGYCCDTCGVHVYAAPGRGTVAAKTPRGELICTKCGGTWESIYLGSKNAGFNLSNLPFEDQVQGIVREELTIVDCIGTAPIRRETEKLKHYNAARLRLMRAAMKATQK